MQRVHICRAEKTGASMQQLINWRSRLVVLAAAVAVLAACQPDEAGEKGSADFFVKAPSVTPTFALTPSYLPPGVETTPTLRLLNRSNDLRQASYRGQISIVTSSERFDATDTIFWDRHNPLTPVTVGGQAGKLMVSEFSANSGAVTWQRKPGQWVLVEGRFTSDLRTMLLRVAEGLRDQQQTGKPSFKIAAVPAGAALLAVDSTSLRLGPPGPDAPTVTVSVTNPGSDNDIGDDTADAKRVKVGKLSGWLQKKDGILRLTLEVSDSMWLSVHAANADPWNEDRLKRFAEGVEYIGPRPIES